MYTPEFTLEIAIVLGLVGATVLLFLLDWIRVDVVAILIMVLLPLIGILHGREAFAGLSSNAVVSIIAVVIMGRGLDHAGVINRLVKPLMALAGTSRRRIIVLLSATVGVISSFMQNVGAAALFLPAIRRLGRHAEIPVSQLLMPVGFAAILGGTITLVGSSPLIMLNDLLTPYGLEPFNLFSVTPVGLAFLAMGIVYFVVAGPRLLPGGGEDAARRAARPAERDPIAYYPGLGHPVEMIAPPALLRDLRIMDLCNEFNVHTVAVSLNNGHDVLMPPDRAMRIVPGSVLAAYATPEQASALARAHGFTIKPGLEVFAARLSDDVSGVREALIPPHSVFVGRTLGEIRFRHNHLMAPLAVTHDEVTRYTGFADVVLRPGDSVLMHGTWEAFHAMRPRRDILFAQSLDHEILHPEKAGLALGCFALATALTILTDLQLSVCLMTGALGMVLTRVLTIDEAYRGVDWRTVFLLAGLIPLGVAMEKTGAAGWLAYHLVEIMGSPPPLVFHFVLGLIATAFTLVVSNVGAVALLVPLAVGMATDMGTDPRLAALVVALAASNSFVLPTHQVNALYMGPGRYRSLDFVKAGAPLSVLFLFVLTLMIGLFY
ncbi:MAG: SLC13 family permease [Desulfovibrionaceae bacterium]|jgi:di/tricarboxylate transporter|nr:SLC13 family permease [Desulfovibrionaceae bacterium]